MGTKIWCLLALLTFAQASLAREIRKRDDGSPSEWTTLQDEKNRSGIQTPCPGFEIPYGQSRNARAIGLSCGGGSSQFTRFPVPFNYKEWARLEGAGDREGMQALRKQDPAVRWEGQIPVSVNVSWSWTAKYRGQNGSRCDYDYIPQQCHRPTYRTVQDCHYEADPEPSSSYGGSDYGSGGGGGFSGGSSGGGGRSYESEGSSRWGSDNKIGIEPKIYAEKALDFFVSSAHARQVCTSRQEYAGEEYYTCYDQIARTCTWEETQSESVNCRNRSVKYTAEYSRPDESWAPGKTGYLDILPNKYELLPGEWEKISLSLSGGSSMQVNFDANKNIENRWNDYTSTVNQNAVRCSLDESDRLDLKIKTVGRIKRKTPNSLVIPVDDKGEKKKHLIFNEIGVNERVLPGRPYEVRLVDQSYQLMNAAARQSRQFQGEVAVVANKKEKGTAMTQGFWKDTQFRLRLIQIRKGLSRNILFTESVYTNGSYIRNSGESVAIPLEGEGGISNLFRPSGTPLLLSTIFGSYGDVQLFPGENYELRISMYQRGLPFYESGCNAGVEACEGEGANDKAFSDELVIAFQAHPDVDMLTNWEKFLAWQRKSLWQKLKFW